MLATLLTEKLSPQPHEDKTVKIWDAATGSQLSDLRGHTDRQSIVLATLLTEKLSPQPPTIKLSKYGMRQPVANSQTYEDTLTESIVLATLLTEKLSPQPLTIKLSKYGMRQPVANSQTYEDILGVVLSVSYSPDGKTIATASEDQTVEIRTQNNGKWAIVRTISGVESNFIAYQAIV